jgi:16S rRNA (guanine(966)-N(2))-methyltransferase RsmD
MRIYGHRVLKTLPGALTRPTTARVREALFNIWQGTISDCYWLDLCAGNGSMGAEALCRGAKMALAIEKSARACAIIKQNWQRVASPEQHFQVIRGDVITQLPGLTAKFNRIYCDPPYHSGLYEPVLEAIAACQLLDMGGEIAVEHDPKLWQAVPTAGLEICREKSYGSTALTFYRLA